MFKGYKYYFLFGITLLFVASMCAADYFIADHSLPAWASVAPPLISIVLALITRQVYVSLLFGVIVGASLVGWSSGQSGLAAIGASFLSVPDHYVISALSDTGHISIVVFSMFIGAMVMIISANGGMRGVVAKLSRYAQSRRSGMLVTWLMGIVIFFDDYANTLVVGNTMRSVTDRLKISREKLAYIVDSTTAPIAAIAFVTTWIGAELSYIQEGLDHTTLDSSAYKVFIQSLAYSFYPILTLLFVLFVIVSGRDFGPMANAERLAANKADSGARDAEITSDSSSDKWWNAAVPVAIVVFGTIVGLVCTGIGSDPGSGHSFVSRASSVIGAADSFKSLLWSSFIGMIVAAIMTVAQRLMSLEKVTTMALDGCKSMFNALAVLTLAWCLSSIAEDLHTSDFIVGLLVDTNVSPQLMPAITFVIAGIMAFSTGTSWGTMSIVYPLVLPAVWSVSQVAGLDADAAYSLFCNAVASVLAGAVWGDHCSPISDTTILSSLSCDCNHIQHVNTQMPYAITVGVVSLLCAILPVGFGLNPLLAFVASSAVLFAVVLFVGKK